MSTEIIKVPDLGDAGDVEVIEIPVAVGQAVAENDSLVVLESDKAAMEIPAPMAGVVKAIAVNLGDPVATGAAILTLETANGGGGAASDESAAVESAAVDEPEAETAPPATPEAAPAPAEPIEPVEPPVAAQKASPEPAAPVDPPATTTAQPASRPSPDPAPSMLGAPSPPAATDAEPASGANVYAGPAVRKLARELGVDLTRVQGSGAKGRIVKEDVHAFVKTNLREPAGGAMPAAIADIDFSRFGEVEQVKRSKLAKSTAANMHRNWLAVPQVAQFEEADVTELEAFRASLKREAEARGVKLTPLPFLLKACAACLAEFPRFNVSLHSSGEYAIQKKYIHIGVAVATDAGLFVPVVRDVDRKNLWQLAGEVAALSAKARERKLTPEDMQGAGFTISSLGAIGGTGFIPIVNTPEVAILGVARTAIKPVWNGSEFTPRTMLPLTLTYDHKAVNGADGGRFATHLATVLGDIRRLLL